MRRTIAKRRRTRSQPAHLEFIREIGICLACGILGRCVPMHIRIGTDGGTGLKPSDRYTVPGCNRCHHRQHQIGERTFWAQVGIDPRKVADDLWEVSPSSELGYGAVVVARSRLHVEDYPL